MGMDGNETSRLFGHIATAKQLRVRFFWYSSTGLGINRKESILGLIGGTFTWPLDCFLLGTSLGGGCLLPFCTEN